MNMTPEQLRAECARLAELAAKATPGPWRVVGPDIVSVHSDARAPVHDEGQYHKHNTALIAAAHEQAAVVAAVPALLDEKEAALAENATLRQRIAELERKYYELILAVGNKYPGEKRHETALRYIKQAETTGVAMQAQTKEGGK